MNITLFDLENLKKSCDNMSQLIKAIKNQYNADSDNRKLFVSRADYDESLRVQKLCPQDFYFFRDFDVFIQLVYNKRLNKYQIYLDNWYHYSLNRFERLPQSDKSYIISKDWNEAYSLYRSLIFYYLQEKIEKENGLF